MGSADMAKLLNYPSGFHDWPEEKRNQYFAKAATEYGAKKRATAEVSTRAPVGSRRERSLDGASAFSEAALARRFVERHEGDLRFVDKWGRWIVWDGTR